MGATRRDFDPSPPDEEGTTDGLRWARFDARGVDRPHAALLVLHGADSTRLTHLPFCRAARAAGFTALAFDARGHGESEGALGASAIEDLATLRALLPADVPLALRGSSMGGYLSLVAAEPLGARAVIAICPALAEGLARGLKARRFAFRADRSLEAFLVEHDERLAAEAYEGGLLLLHAEGDDVVPVQRSRDLHAAARRASPSRLVVVPGGDHRSAQHDPELQALSLRWLRRAVAAPAGRA